jgi:hypothetical protein
MILRLFLIYGEMTQYDSDSELEDLDLSDINFVSSDKANKARRAHWFLTYTSSSLTLEEGDDQLQKLVSKIRAYKNAKEIVAQMESFSTNKFCVYFTISVRNNQCHTTFKDFKEILPGVRIQVVNRDPTLSRQYCSKASNRVAGPIFKVFPDNKKAHYIYSNKWISDQDKIKKLIETLQKENNGELRESIDNAIVSEVENITSKNYCDKSTRKVLTSLSNHSRYCLDNSCLLPKCIKTRQDKQIKQEKEEYNQLIGESTIFYERIKEINSSTCIKEENRETPIQNVAVKNNAFSVNSVEHFQLDEDTKPVYIAPKEKSKIKINIYLGKYSSTDPDKQSARRKKKNIVVINNKIG